jgi:hypothetical protein
MSPDSPLADLAVFLAVFPAMIVLTHKTTGHTEEIQIVRQYVFPRAFGAWSQFQLGEIRSVFSARSVVKNPDCTTPIGDNRPQAVGNGLCAVPAGAEFRTEPAWRPFLQIRKVTTSTHGEEGSITGRNEKGRQLAGGAGGL